MIPRRMSPVGRTWPKQANQNKSAQDDQASASNVDETDQAKQRAAGDGDSRVQLPMVSRLPSGACLLGERATARAKAAEVAGAASEATRAVSQFGCCDQHAVNDLPHWKSEDEGGMSYQGSGRGERTSSE